MQKCLFKSFVSIMVLLLAGCQTATGPSFFGTAPSYAPYSTRMSLAETIQAELARSDDLYIAQVRVVEHQNLVILSGYVKKIRQSDLAEKIAGQIAGPQNVRNNIIVRP